MPSIRQSILIFLAQGLLWLCIGGLSAQESSTTDRLTPKNIINIILDDADYSDFGFNNYQLSRPDAITPNIDKLRRGGRLFPNYPYIDERAQTAYSLLMGNNRLTKAENRNPFAANAYLLNDLQADPTGRANVATTNPAIVDN